MLYQFHAQATVALHAMEKINTQSLPKTTQIAKGAMVHTPFIVKKLAYAAIILCHG
jgi:hypothetical protein